MAIGRRALWQGGLAVAGAALASRALAGPLVRGVAVREVAETLAGLPTTDGAGVRLLRVIGQPALRHLDPFVMLDRFHSDDPGAYIAGFPDHPHRGFETVTVMLAGRMRHRDTRGGHGLILGGGSQWMTAGRGIVHSEMPEQDRGLMSGFQLWINLPAKEKMRPQEYQDLQPAQLAEGKLSPAGSKARVIAGRLDGLHGPVRQRATDPLLFTLALEDDRPFSYDVGREHAAFVFVSSGEVELGPEGRARLVPEGTLAILGPGHRVRARATNRRSELLCAAAAPLREPIVQRGPFVMNTEAEIRKAFEDYRSGVLDKA
jgi:redox-sensitive bicupin YhaK (pirin superfamily)